MTVEHSDVSAEDAFHLPLTGLFADVDAGCGCVRLTDEFEDCDVVAQVRIVQDWQRDLQNLQHASLERLFQAKFATLALSRAEQIRRFNTYCAQTGLECPPDLAARSIEGALWAYTSTTQ